MAGLSPNLTQAPSDSPTATPWVTWLFTDPRDTWSLRGAQGHLWRHIWHNNKNGPFKSIFWKLLNFVWYPGPTSANMGPYSQDTTEAPKSIVDMWSCDLLTYWYRKKQRLLWVLRKAPVSVWGHHKIKGLAKYRKSVYSFGLHWGYILLCSSCPRGGGQKLAEVRLLRYCCHIFSVKGIQLFSLKSSLNN